MKKVALSLAGLLAAAAFAPEASALPVFARQTGMACNACHFQHFPLLNGFGRSFKASGFTLMGAEGKVEGDGLSIPNVVNAAVLTSMGYEKTNAHRVAPLNTSGAAGNNAFTGGFFVAGASGEASLFLGGRGSDFMGFLTEVTMGNGAAAVDSFKTPIITDVGAGARAGVVFFTTNGQGASYGYETMNTGANAIHSITNTVGQNNNQYINAVSAQQYIGTGAAATGASVVAIHDNGFINVTKFLPLGPAGVGLAGGVAGNNVTAPLSDSYLRLAIMGDLGGWDAGIGAQSWSGSSLAAGFSTKATAVDAQLQGSAGGMPLGIYFSYAKAPVITAVGAPINQFNACVAAPGAPCFTKSAFNVAAELGVVPEKVTVGAAIRRGKAGFADANGSNAGDNAIYLTATYKLAQNLLTRFSYVSQSGSAWVSNAANTGTTNLFGSKSWTVNLYALF